MIAEGAGAASTTGVITALGGVIISVATVLLNQKKNTATITQVSTTTDDRARALQAQVRSLEQEVARLRKGMADQTMESKRNTDMAIQLRDDRDRLRDLIDTYGNRKLRRHMGGYRG